MRKELNKKEPEHKDLENSQLSPITKHGKACPEKNIKGVVEQPFHKDINMGVNHGPPLCKHQLESQLEWRKTETGSKEGRLPDFLDPRALQPCLCVILQDEEGPQRRFREDQGHLLDLKVGEVIT